MGRPKKVGPVTLETSGGPISSPVAVDQKMLRIIDGVAFEGKLSPDRWAVSKRDLGGGHVEVSVRQCVDWHEAGWDYAKHRATLLDMYGEEGMARRDAEEAAARREASALRAARRAKTRVRHLVKVQALDTLLTLTYRENFTDEAGAWRHLKAFARRMRSALGAFAYVAVMERQKRGAIHWHLAVHRLPAVMAAKGGVKVKSFNVVRALWRAVVGELGGNVDASRRKAHAQRSGAKIAAYLSKYVTKAFAEGTEGANRYSASMGVKIPAADRREMRAESLRALLANVYPWAFDAPGIVMVSAWVDRFNEAAYFAAELARNGPEVPSYAPNVGTARDSQKH